MSVSIPTTQEIELTLQDVFTTTFGSDINFDPSTPTGQLVSNLTDAMQSLWEGIQSSYSASRADQATGQQLDDLAALLNIKRSDGLKTVCQSCTLTGTAGTIIPAGSQAKNEQDIIFESTNQVTITGTSAVVDFVSLDIGVYDTPVNTLTTIVTPISGWTSITNPTSGAGGATDQSDPKLRKDIITRSQNLSSNLAGSIRGAIEGVDGVISSFVFVNYTSVPAPTPFLNPPRTVLCVVYYLDTTIDDDIGEAIYSRLPCSDTAQSTAGGTQKSYIKSISGTNLTIYWLQAAALPVNFEIAIEQNSSFTADDENAMRSAIESYLDDNQEVNEVLYYSDIYYAAKNAVPEALIESFYVSTNATPGSNDIVTVPCPFYNILTPGTINISYGA